MLREEERGEVLLFCGIVAFYKKGVVVYGNVSGGATTVSNPHCLKMGGWSVSTLTLHIASRRTHGASGQEIASFLRSVVEPGQQAQLDAALYRCGYDPEGRDLVRDGQNQLR